MKGAELLRSKELNEASRSVAWTRGPSGIGAIRGCPAVGPTALRSEAEELPRGRGQGVCVPIAGGWALGSPADLVLFFCLLAKHFSVSFGERGRFVPSFIGLVVDFRHPGEQENDLGRLLLKNQTKTAALGEKTSIKPLPPKEQRTSHAIIPFRAAKEVGKTGTKGIPFCSRPSASRIFSLPRGSTKGRPTCAPAPHLPLQRSGPVPQRPDAPLLLPPPAGQLSGETGRKPPKRRAGETSYGACKQKTPPWFSSQGGAFLLENQQSL